MKLFILLTFLFSLNLFAKTKTVILKYDQQFILNEVLKYKNLELNRNIPFPALNYKSRTTLKKFQDAVEEQWDQRPKEITNVFVFKSNEIYLLDDADYYKKAARCIDDSFAHELTHYVQLKYQNYDMNDESLEWEAVDVQNWFRENFCK